VPSYGNTTEILRNIRMFGYEHTLWWTRTLKPPKMINAQMHLTIFGIILVSFHSLKSSILSLCLAPKYCYQLENVLDNTQIGFFFKCQSVIRCSFSSAFRICLQMLICLSGRGIRQGLTISPSSFTVAKPGETRWRFSRQHCLPNWHCQCGGSQSGGSPACPLRSAPLKHYLSGPVLPNNQQSTNPQSKAGLHQIPLASARKCRYFRKHYP
jgi:hypothetical protein